MTSVAEAPIKGRTDASLYQAARAASVQLSALNINEAKATTLAASVKTTLLTLNKKKTGDGQDDLASTLISSIAKVRPVKVINAPNKNATAPTNQILNLTYTLNVASLKINLAQAEEKAKAPNAITKLGDAINKSMQPIVDTLLKSLNAVAEHLAELIAKYPIIGRAIGITMAAVRGLSSLRKMRDELKKLFGSTTAKETAGVVRVWVVNMGSCSCLDGCDGYAQGRSRKPRKNRRPKGARKPTGGIGRLMNKVRRGLSAVAGSLSKMGGGLLGRVGRVLGNVAGKTWSAGSKMGSVAWKGGSALIRSLSNILPKVGGFFAKTLGKSGGLLTALTYAPDIIDGIVTGDTKKAGTAVGGLGGTLAGAAAGAALGSAVPIVGTVIGGLVGGIVGGLGGESLGSWVGGMFDKTAPTENLGSAATGEAKQVITNITNNITAPQGMDADTLARAIARRTSEQSRGALYDYDSE